MAQQRAAPSLCRPVHLRHDCPLAPLALVTTLQGHHGLLDLTPKRP
jgi:hypothetical protein